MNKKYLIVAEHNRLAAECGLPIVDNFKSKAEAYRALVDLQQKLQELKQRPVSYCRYYINNNVLAGRKESRKEYIRAMLRAGIARGTADYAWASIFKKDGLQK